MEAGLKILVGADVSQAEKGLKQINAAVDNTSKNFAKLPNASNQATFALTNLSRVAQDAPFGFTAIANNTDPLITSFVNLKKETGSVKGAFSALGASLAGGGGLILITGLVSAAMTIFGDKLFSSGKKAEETKDKIRDLNDVLNSSVGATAGEIESINSLVSVIDNSNESYDRRKQALDQLKQVNKSYFGDLDIEKIKTGELTSLVADYTAALIASAKAKGLEQEISKVNVDLLKEQDTLAKLEEAYNSVKGSALASLKAQQQFGASFQQVVQPAFKESGALESLTNQQSVVNKLKEQYTLLQNAIKSATSELLDKKPLNEIKDISKEEDKRVANNEKVKKSIQEQNDALFAQLGILSAFRSNLPNAVSQVGKGQAEKPSEGVKPLPLPFFDLEGKGVKYFEQVDKLKAKIENTGFKIPVEIDQTNLQDLSDWFDSFSGKVETLRGLLTDSLGRAFQDLFKNILTGGKDAFQAFGQAIKQVITQLIAAAAASAVVAGIISAITGTPFKVNFRASFALLSGVKFAQGGIVNKPTYGLFGEAGPEAVIPLDRLSNLISTSLKLGFNAGSTLGIANRGGDRLVAEVRGSDLAFVLARTNNTYSRLG
jgi:hypothetical protein